MGFLDKLARGIGRVYGTVDGVARYGPKIVAHKVGEGIGAAQAYGQKVLRDTGEQLGQSVVEGVLEKVQEPEPQEAIHEVVTTATRDAVQIVVDEVKKPYVQETVQRVADTAGDVAGRSAAEAVYQRSQEPDVQEAIQETIGYATRPIRTGITAIAILGAAFFGGYLLYKLFLD